jgi:hypothetical protein
MILAPTYRGVRKPSASATINWNHPLSRGLKICTLFNEGKIVDATASSTQARNYADPSNPAIGFNTNQLNPASTVGRGGASRGLINNSANAPGFQYKTIPINGVSQFTMFVRATEQLNGVADPNPIFLAATAPIVSFTQYQNGIYIYFGSTNGWHFVTTASSQVFVNAGYIGGAGSASLLATDACGVYDGTNAIFYGNGLKMASAAQSGTVSTSTTLSHFSDTTNNSAETYAGVLVCAMLWTRALTPAEVLSLSISPYQMFYTGGKVFSRSTSVFGGAAGPGGGGSTTTPVAFTIWGR